MKKVTLTKRNGFYYLKTAPTKKNDFTKMKST